MYCQKFLIKVHLSQCRIKITFSYLPTPELEVLEWIRGSDVQVVVTGVTPPVPMFKRSLDCHPGSFLLAWHRVVLSEWCYSTGDADLQQQW